MGRKKKKRNKNLKQQIFRFLIDNPKTQLIKSNNDKSSFESNIYIWNKIRNRIELFIIFNKIETKKQKIKMFSYHDIRYSDHIETKLFFLWQLKINKFDTAINYHYYRLFRLYSQQIITILYSLFSLLYRFIYLCHW